MNIDVAILNIAFSPNETKIATSSYRKFAVASSGGRVDLYNFEHSLGLHPVRVYCLTSIKSCQLFEENILVLDIVWHPVRETEIAITLSTGDVVMCSLHLSGTDNYLQTTQLFSHTLEAWVTSYSIDGRLLYSGGDDCVFACHELQLGINGTKWEDKKIHGAGVTAILPILQHGDNSEEVLLTGSYDDHVRVLATPVAGGKRPTVLADLDLGGGVWRLAILQAPPLQPSSSDSNLRSDTSLQWIILASCMYAGTRIVQVQKHNMKWDIRLLARFEEHKSMNYGSGVKPRSADDQNGYKLVSTSFYDKLMCLWKFDADVGHGSTAQKS